MKNQDILESLTGRREFLESELAEAKRVLEREQRQYEKVETALMLNEIEIDEFKRECFTSPKIDVLKIDSRVRRLLKDAGIVTVYELRWALKTGKYINGVGGLNRARLDIALNNYDSERSPA